MSTIQKYIAGALALIILFGVGVCIGNRKGHLDEKLAQNKTQIVANDKETTTIGVKAEASRKEASTLDSTHSIVRARVHVVHDTVIVHSRVNIGENSSDSVIIVSPEIAQLILAADSTIAAQKRALALQDTLVASLRRGIALRDTRISLLEKKGNPRFSKGIQLGVGYCATQAGNSPCLYAGYGGEFRMP